ncbi:Protein held out wing-like protein [Dinothrombium tinctorium]|uniref:Protein held out wing-like protein n=1 Tax=Dinothrombium tinctorium TaxID=1965070 RepID=A0A3S3PLZ3_9ACAR|nr:Protein held out wing-like protein [Dinothrombium tinctorium]
MGENNNTAVTNANSTPTSTSTAAAGSVSTAPSTTSSTSIMNNINAVLNQQSSLITMQSTADYLAQLLKDKKQLQAFPNVFLHIERLLDEEINKVRSSLFQINGVEKKPLILPEPEGPILQKQEKVYVPVKDHPDYNFVGRILGPRGMTAKQLEQETGCKIMVRGRGSMRDKKKEEQNRGKPNWEHLNDDLHVLITVEDTANRATAKIQRAVEEIQKLLVPVTDGEDELKKRQLMELAIINGTYRDSSSKSCLETEHMKLIAPQVALTTSLRTPTATPLGAPLIISPRHIHVPTSAALINGSGPPPLMTPAEAGLLYAPYDFHQYAALTSPLLAEYPVTTTSAETLSTSGTGKQRRTTISANRDHPYQRSAS